MTARLTRRTSYVLRIHIIDIVGKSKQVILYHTHHTGGVTDIVGYQNMLLWITSTFSGGVIPTDACYTAFYITVYLKYFHMLSF